MRPYKHTPLTDPTTDIRLIDLLPGEFEDDICLAIIHTPLQWPRPEAQPDGRLSLEQLRATLPKGWMARVTTEGRFLFNDKGIVHTTSWQWEHPDPTFDRSKYELPRSRHSAPSDDNDCLPISPRGTGDSDDGSDRATCACNCPCKCTCPCPCPGPSYEALSYTWGSGTSGGDEEIYIVDGPPTPPTPPQSPQPPSRPDRQPHLGDSDPDPHPSPVRAHAHADTRTYATMTAGRSLAVALRHLRLRDRTRRLWIDAICINQGDDGEKNHQVRRMGAIFEGAHRVVGFLGEAADDSSLALEALRHLGRQVEVIVPSIRVCSPDAVSQDLWERDTDLGWDGATWRAVHALLARRWFTRLWIIQESRLAGRCALVQCGRDSIPLSLFRRAVKCLKGKNSLPMPGLKVRLEYVLLMTDDQRGLPFCAVLDMGHNRGCVNPRDRVYGLLGMSPPGLASKLRPSYARPVVEVLRDTVLTHMRHCGRLELLKRCCQSGRAVADLPSWVPDLTSPGAAIINLTRSSQFATGHSRAHFTYRHQVEPEPEAGKDRAVRDVLTVLGVRCATVSAVSEPLPPGCESAGDVIRSWEPPDLDTATYPVTGESLRLVHARTLRTNIFKERYPGFKCTDLDQWLVDNDDGRGRGKTGSGLWGNGIPPPPASSYAHGRAIKLCTGKTYVRTHEGYVGLAPADARPGDIIVLLLGCDSPILLRERTEQRPPDSERTPGSDSSSFTVMGECFVYGLHDTTGLLGPLPAPWRVELKVGFGNRLLFQFVNGESRFRTDEDPRFLDCSLGPWERITATHRGEADDPEIFDYFRNKETGEVMNSDPRMLPDALRARGINMSTFDLV